MDISADNSSDETNRRNSSEFVDLTTDLEIDLLSRRTSSQSDDNSIFAHLDADNSLFGELPDEDDNLQFIGDTSRAVSLDPIVSINPIRLPLDSSLLSQNTADINRTQSSVTVSPVPSIPSKRGPGRPRKDGKVPIQRKNLFPGRPRMRGRKTLNVLGVGPNSPGTETTPTKPKPSLSLVNMSSGLSIKPITGVATTRTNDSPRVELNISSGIFSSQLSASSIPTSDDSNMELESRPNTRVCIFCNLSDNFSLSLGKLTRCEPTPGFSPIKRLARLRRSPVDETLGGASSEASASRNGNKDPKFARRGTEVQKVTGPMDQLNLIGFSDESSIMSLFESSGHCWAHHCCAAWSEEVRQNEDYILMNVDKAVCMGAQQRCCQCHKLGATIGCKSSQRCNRYYHYACAVIAGTFQDIRSLTLLCIAHLSETVSIFKEESICPKCVKSGDVSELLFCTSCGQHYHGSCLDPKVIPTANVRAGWQCPHCKICQTCHKPGDDSKMLICDTCDNGYHPFCLSMSTVPKHGWKCKDCRACGDCGARTPGNGPSSRWHMNYTVCDSCYQQRNKGSSCPICGKAYRQACQSEMLQCITCRKLIHPTCEPKLSHGNDLSPEMANNYVCKVCETSVLNDPKDDFASVGLPDNIFNASRESFGSFTEDSLGSIDNLDVPPIGHGFDSTDTKIVAISTNNNTNTNNNGQSLIRPPAPVSGGKIAGKKRLNYPGKMRGGKFPGRKRAKTVEFRRKRGPKTKFKPFAGPSSSLAMASSGILNPSNIPECDVKEKIKDDDPANENKVILCSTKDEFVLSQDLCAMCGSAGQAEEGRLISCSQCGQCYHPFCVNIKVTKVVLNKGWRCLECTVCEGCGLPHDEARLLLCDDCDISYHTYCLEPPLDVVPQGTWKCRWCVVCLKCKSTNPGFGSLWQKNYTECGPCASQTSCPVCQNDYTESDLIIQCIQCNRWLHSKCDGMTTEDDCESAADIGYHCILCRPKDEPPPHLLARKLAAQTSLSKMVMSAKAISAESIQNSTEKSLIRRDSEDSIASKASVSALMTAQVSQASTPTSAATSATPTSLRPMAPKIQPQFHFVDGVWLSDRGLNQIKTLQLEQPKRTRVKRGTKQALNAIKAEEMDEVSKEDEGSLEDKQTEDNTALKGDENGEKKKRQRRLHKLGIGGFSVKQRGRMSATKDDETNGLSFEMDANESISNQESVGNDKPKRRRRISKKKNQLQDSFPQYMQEAFFGKSLLITSQTETTQATVSTTLSEEDDMFSKNITKDKLIVLTPNEIAAVKSQKPKHETTSVGVDDKSESPLDDDDDFQDLLPPLPPDDELMDMLDHITDDGLDRNDESLSNLSVDGKESDNNAKDDAIDLLSPHFNLDGIVGASSLPQMDSKDVEDLFKGVLSPHNTEDSNDFNTLLGPSTSSLNNKALLPMQIPPPPLTSPLAPPSTQNLMPASSVPLPQLMHSKQSNIDSNVSVPMIDSPYNMPTPSPFPVPIDSSAQYSPQISEPQSPWPSEGEEPITSQGQKNMIKWEADEALGQMATISPVLYANLNHPNLKTEFPIWNDRIKQISKLWRQLATDQRQPFLQKARENRAANRIQKAQSETQRRTESVKEVRAAPPLPPVSVRDGENERQWKHLQASRQQQQVQHQQVIHEQRQSLLKTQTIGPISPGADNRPFMQSIPPSPSPMTREYCSAESGPPMTPVPLSPMQSPVQVGAPFGASMTRPQVQSPSNTSPMSPVIQVSRVRPPIDPNKLPVSSAGSKPMQYDPYSQPPNTPRPQMSLQPILKPSTPQQRSPFSPSSPGASHLNMPIPQSSTETFQTPPSTPRPQSTDAHNQTSMPSSPYGQPRTPQSSPFSPNHNMMSQSQQQCVDSYPVQRPQPSFGEYQNNPNENSPNTECLYPNVGQRMAQRTPDPFPPNMTSPNPDIYSRPMPTPQPPQSPQAEPMIKMNIQNDPYARPPMTPRPQLQQPLPQRQPMDDIYSQQPSTPQMVQQSNAYIQPMTPRPNFQQTLSSSPMQSLPPHDPYAYQPNTPRPVPSRPTLQSIRQPMMRPPPTSPVDPYARQPGTPMPPPLQDPYAKSPGTPMPMSANDRPQEGNDNQLSRQHLRDLLQRQQVRRQQVSDVPPRLWPVPNQSRPHNDGQFRLPIPPGAMGRPRIGTGFPSEQVFRHPGTADQRIMVQRMADPRMRPGFVQQPHHFADRTQQQWIRMPGPGGQHPPGPQAGLSAQGPNPEMNQYGQMMTINRMPTSGYGGLPIRQLRPQFVRPPLPSQPMDVQNNELVQIQSSGHQSSDTPTPNPQQPSDTKIPIQPSPNSKTPTTSDIVKQLQEQQNPDLVEEECPTDDLDDDELLGLGNDFNILEYADPELDKHLSGKSGGKSNIFDEHLDDLDDKEDVDEKNKSEKSENKTGTKAQLNEPKPEIKQENSQSISPQSAPRMPAPIPSMNVRMPFPPPPPYPGQDGAPLQPPPPPPPPYPQARPMNQAMRHPIPTDPPSSHTQLRPTLLQDQPLLLEELVEQEKRDLRQSNPMNARNYGQQMNENMMSQPDSLLSDVEFERLKADILSDEPIHGPPIPSMTTNQPQMQNYSQPMANSMPSSHWQNEPQYQGKPRMSMGPRMVHNPRNPMFQQNVGQMSMQGVRMAPNIRPMQVMPPSAGQPMTPPMRHQLVSLPPPPTPPAEPMNEMERQQQLQYESWLMQQTNVLSQQQKFLETEVAKLRKAKKMLTTKQRQCKKNQNDLSEQDLNELARIGQEQSSLQKNLEQVRKSLRQHQIIANEYNKQRPKQSLVGVSQTAISLPQSPGSSSIPSMQTSPRSVHSPLMALGSSGPGTPIAMAGPTTPQSPAIMSPSPLGPSASPLMQNSPIPSLHSPAGMPPSPMVQSVLSPMPPQMSDPNIRPQMTPQSVHIIDDNNPFSDVYQQKEKMQIQSMRPMQPIQAMQQTSSSASFPHMMGPDMAQNEDRQKMFRQISFHNEDNMQYQQPGPHQQTIRTMQAQHTTSHYQQSNETQMFRYPNQHVHIQRPYPELVGQPYPAQLPANYQQQQQHTQMSIRRPPPPPYPGSIGQGQHPQMAQQQQQQMHRMYGSPQVATMSRMHSPIHPMHSPVSGKPSPSRTPSNEFEVNQFEQNIAHTNYPTSSGECSPRRTPVSSYSMPEDNSSMHSSLNSDNMFHSNNEHLSNMQFKSETDSCEQKPSLVGEAKTSLTFNIDEQGSGRDNEAGNELLSSASESAKATDQQIVQNVNNQPIKIKQEMPDSCSHSELDSQSQEHIVVAKEEKVRLPCALSQQSTSEVKRNSSEDKTNVQFSENESNNMMNDSESDNNEDSLHTRQNALLKQLLQNCPSADSQAKAIESLIKGNGEQNEANTANDNNNNTGDTKAAEEPVKVNDPPITSVEPLPKDQLEPNSTPAPISSAIAGDPNTSTTPPILPQGVSPEKKMSYLDIRRAQLEREPTPPPEEIKPKRKRMTKRKESKSPDALGGDPMKPGAKKRSRKASQSRADEDSEMFLATLMAQLRTLPPLQILEPVIKPNLNVCQPFDASDMNSKESPLRGSYGKAFLSSAIDYYSTYPFGPKKAPPLTPSLPPCAINSASITSHSNSANSSSIGMPSTSRGFYNEEFSKTSNSSLQSNYKTIKEVNPYLRDCESPDSIVSSSSPETVLYDYPTDSLKGLKLISIDSEDDEQELKDINNNRSSPDIPLIVSIPIRPIPIMPSLIPQRRVSDNDSDKDKENALETNTAIKSKTSVSAPLRDAGNVDVTLTLSSAEDVRGILTALAKYLDIPTPNTFEIIERTDTPPSQKLGLYNKEDVESAESELNIQSVLNGKIQVLKTFCKFCDIVVLNAGIKKKASELSFSTNEQLEEEEEVIFCSTNCYMQFALSHRGLATPEKEAAAVVAHRHSTETPVNEIKPEKAIFTKKSMDSLLPPISPMMEDDDISDQEMVSLNQSPKLEELSQETPREPFVSNESAMEVDSASHTPIESIQFIESSESKPKKYKDICYRYWNNQFSDKKSDKTEADEEEEDEKAGLLLDKLSICVKPNHNSAERRKCVLCHETGDGHVDGPARLLNMDVDKWIHLNCALWSSEVYEMLNGGLMNVDQACKRALTLSCFKCHKTGASLRCYRPRCTNSYHFPCALKDGCMLFKDKTLLCSQHALKIQSNEEMTTFVVFRRVFVNRDEQKQIASMIHMGDNNLLRIGNLIFVSIGQLLPHQLQAFHTPNYIYPIGYKIIRFYWSWRRFGKRCQYVCSIEEVDSRPEFVIEIKEDGLESVIFRDKTPKSVWLKILEPIVRMRADAKSIKLFTDYITGEDLFGLSEPAIVRILESLPGVDTLSDYNFRYGRSPLLELPLAINPTGCARTEPKLRTHFKRPHRLHVSASTSSRSSIQSSFSGIEISSPYVKQFVHSKSSQYRKMKLEWRNIVYLARSRIQGLGLYAVKDIEKHTMVIEYIGLLIRNEIAERNERIYEAHNRGVYMFRLDDNRVIDATLKGGLARYVNHSCDPNCVAECVQIDRENKILIIANRRIQRGEELTYDYKFDVEDDQHKIPCNCGAANCRKWMN